MCMTSESKLMLNEMSMQGGESPRKEVTNQDEGTGVYRSRDFFIHETFRVVKFHPRQNFVHHSDVRKLIEPNYF